MACPAPQCGSTFSRNAWERHFDTECDKIELKCEKCDGSVNKAEMAAHDCVTVLKELISREKEARERFERKSEGLEKTLQEKN